jgi:hypothetical protein
LSYLKIFLFAHPKNVGKITKAQIKAGNEALSRIEACIKEGKFGNDYTEALNAYYTVLFQFPYLMEF